MTEEWRSISGFPDYEISSQGRVRRTTSRGRWKAGHLLIISDNGRYPKVVLYQAGGYKIRYIHTLVLEAFVGPRPEGLECNHKDGVKKNTILDNFEWTTHSENEKHANRLGLKRFAGFPSRAGELHPLHRLKTEDVMAIKGLLSAGEMSQGRIAEIYGVSQTQISRIHLEKRWRCIKEAL